MVVLSHHHVFYRREVLYQVELLKDEANLAATHRGQFQFTHFVQTLALQVNQSFGGGIQTAQNVHQS